MRSWGVSSPPDLSRWLRDQGFASSQPSNHIPARAQEFLIGEACRFDARVALLEGVFVRVTLHMGEQMAVPPDSVPANVTRQVEAGTVVRESQRWAQLDAVGLNDWMLRRVPMLKTCPRFMRGRFRQCWGTALRERCRARLAGDVVSESRAWKLFCLVPVMLLHRPRGTGSVGREGRRFRGRQVDPIVERCIRVHSSTAPTDRHSRGRTETPWSSRSVPHPTRPVFPRTARVDRSGIGAQK